MLDFVASLRFRVYPHFTIYYLHRATAHVGGEGIEGATAGEVETGVVPVAGEDAVFDAATVQGEAHVRTAVVHSMNLAIMVEKQRRRTRCR